ncbi:Protein of unknown function [Pyronema omphalodes CBS 100304]|uniref:Uncharacterized protein n=1 Tax=Pyronema omphalodes (strain CBS 100304) TaxID=1076935 RepID=U4KY70_PYROM|nr:Protein of unknown function [Pyronema omphalodes CBS 100304]
MSHRFITTTPNLKYYLRIANKVPCSSFLCSVSTPGWNKIRNSFEDTFMCINCTPISNLKYAMR